MILGLDISTSCTGWCILEDTGAFVSMGAIDLSKENSLYSKAGKIKNNLAALHISYDIQKIFIEENLQAFRPGLSSAKTLLTLARFNGIVSYVCSQEFFKDPIYINVNNARKTLEIKIKRQKVVNKSTKDQVWEWVSDKLKNTNFDWPMKTLKSGPRKNQTILDPSCYDMADAYVIAMAGFEQFKKAN